MSTVLLLSELEAKGILYCAYKGGHRIIVAGNREKNMNLQYHPMCTKFVPLQNELFFSTQSDALVEEIIQVIREEKPDVILPSSFDCIQLVSRYRDRFETETRVMPVPTQVMTEELDNKYQFFLFCNRHGLPHPPSHYVENVEALLEWDGQGAFFPVIFKPVIGAGEEGIAVFDDLAALKAHFSYATGMGLSDLFPALIQEYFDGEDVDFNGFAVKGEIKAWSVMRTIFYTKGPSFTLTDFTDHPGVRDLGMEIVRTSNYSGPLNIDLRIRTSDSQPFLIEVNPRFWARGVYSLMDGVNFVDVGIRTALDDAYSVQSKRTGKLWPQSMSHIVVALIRNRDLSVLSFIKKLSIVQFRYMIFNRYYVIYAKCRRVLATLFQ